MKRIVRLLGRGLLFLLVFLIAFSALQPVFTLNYNLAYENVRGGYLREKENSLDAVYIGASNVYAFWQSLFGWNEQGIAVWSYSFGSMPTAALKYLLIEAHKTQPDAVFIFNLNIVKSNSPYGTMQDIHRSVDFLPFSNNKIRLINTLCDGAGFSGLDKLEFFFPIIRFHSNWSNPNTWTRLFTSDGYKSSLRSPLFFDTVKDVSASYVPTNQQTALPEEIENCINDLLDYCDEQHLKVLFVKAPQAAGKKTLRRMNALEDLVIARGYPCLDLLENIEETGIQFQTDFYNANHTNIHGSLKFCRYLSEYLVKQYGFTDKRNQDGWESWNTAAAAYLEEARSYVLPFELTDEARDYTLSIPSLKAPVIQGDSVLLQWDSSAGADGYEIFRRSTDAAHTYAWQSIATVEGNSAYTDPDLSWDMSYDYRVVPFSSLHGERMYGNFEIDGIHATAGGQE